VSVGHPKSGHKTDSFRQPKPAGKVRNLFNKYLLKPVVISTAVIVFSLSALSPASSAKAPVKNVGSGIVLQSDTLALQLSSGSKPLPAGLQSEIQSILGKISHNYSEVLKTWEIGRQIDVPAELKPLELKLQLVNSAKFEQIEYFGIGVKMDLDAQTIYINSDIFNPDSASHKSELAFVLCYNFSSYGGFTEPVPFDATNILPFLMAYQIAPSAPFLPSPDGEQPPILSDREAVALWFAKSMGIEQFARAYATGDIRALRHFYSLKFGPGNYDELTALVQPEGPGVPLLDSAKIMDVITRHLGQSGSNETAWDQIGQMAHALGYRVPPVQ